VRLASSIVTALPGLKDSAGNTGFVSTFSSAYYLCQGLEEVMFLKCFGLRVCLSVTSITQKQVDGFG